MSDPLTNRLAREDGNPSISAYVIAFNEAEKVEAAVSSLLWADEIIVADSNSTDGTSEIAESLGARVVQIEFQGFGPLRNAAIEHCRGDWIFSLDADERCTPEARDAILKVTSDESSADIWRVPRRNWFMGRWIKHSGWYPNFRQPQLFRRGSMTYDQLPVHEGWIAADGARVDVLGADIWQIPFRNVSELQDKITRYSTLGADKVLAKTNTPRMIAAVARGAVSFVKHLILKRGLLDGWPGFIIAFGAAESSFYKHVKAWEHNQSGNPPASPPLHRPA